MATADGLTTATSAALEFEIPDGGPIVTFRLRTVCTDDPPGTAEEHR